MIADRVTVPREPTRKMWAAAGDAVVALQIRGVGHHDALIAAAWAAMIDAAPLAEVQPSEVAP